MLTCKDRLRAAAQPYQHVCEQCGDGPCTYETLTQRRQREVRAQYAEDAARSMFDRPQLDVDRVSAYAEALKVAREALAKNDEWHRDHDDHLGYPGSEMESTITAALARINALIGGNDHEN